MKRLNRIIPVLLLAAFVASASAQSVSSLYKQGKKAEAQQDYIAAFEAYRKCYLKHPEDLRFRVAVERTKLMASGAYVHQGQEKRDAGDLEGAMNNFDYASKIDPSSFVAEQEMRRTKAMIDAAKGKSTEKPILLPSISSIKNKLDNARGPMELQQVSSMPITLKMSNNSRLIYETVGKLSGINILFDPDYTPKNINLDLNGVSLEDALNIMAFLSKTFWRPITGNTIFVAADTPNKRKELEEQVLKTFYLSNACAATDIQEVQNTIRTVLDIQKVNPVQSQCALIVRGTPDQIALAEKIIGDIDKSKPEIIVDIAVLEVRKDFTKNLGITPPSSISASIVPAGSTTTTSGTGTTGTGTTSTTSSSTNPTLNVLGNLTDKDISVTIPGAKADFLFSNGNSKTIQNPQIRASDGQKATLKIGDRVPIATGSLGNPFQGNGGIGQAGFVNTQFQYIDVGVNIDITPHVHAGKEISLKVSLEVSSVSGTQNIGGVTQPIISQRKIDHEIRLKEGEVNVLGGILQQSDSETVAGLPWLAQLPFLKYLFSSKQHTKSDSEIVFVLIPRIVRSQELTDLNQRAIDIGTGTTIELHPVSKPSKAAEPAEQKPAPDVSPVPSAAITSPATPAITPKMESNPVTTPNSNPTVTKPPVNSSKPVDNTTKPSTPVEGRGSLSFSPPNATHSIGETFTMDVMIKGATDVYASPLLINYDSRTLQVLNVDNGEFLAAGGNIVSLVHREDPEKGTIQLTASRPPGAQGVTGEGRLFTITFLAKYKGDSVLSITNPGFKNTAQQTVLLNAGTANMSVK